MSLLRRRVLGSGWSSTWEAAMFGFNGVSDHVDTSCSYPGGRPNQFTALSAFQASRPLTAFASHRCMSSQAPQQQLKHQSPVSRQLQELRGAFALPPNPFTYNPERYIGPKQVLYRGKGMLLFRFLVRMKVFQLAGVFTVASLMSMVIASDSATAGDIAAAAAVALGCVVTSYCVWYYSGRYIGELSLVLPERGKLCFSVLDFWGSRQDIVVPLSQLDAPFRNRSVSEVKEMVQPVLMPIRAGGREYYISMGHGIVLEKELLLNILYGQPLPPSFKADGEQQPQQRQELKQG